MGRPTLMASRRSLALIAVAAACSGGCAVGSARAVHLTAYWFPVRHVLPRGCRALGGDSELTAQVVLRGGRTYEALACFRAPGVAANMAKVRTMPASARPG